VGSHTGYATGVPGFWWTAGIFAAGAFVGGGLLRRGPLDSRRGSQTANHQDQVSAAHRDGA
jgi:hypothetical protein